MKKVLEQIDLIIDIIEGRKGPVLEGNYAEDGRYGYPKKLSMIHHEVKHLRELIKNPIDIEDILIEINDKYSNILERLA